MPCHFVVTNSNGERNDSVALRVSHVGPLCPDVRVSSSGTNIGPIGAQALAAMRRLACISMPGHYDAYIETLALKLSNVAVKSQFTRRLLSDNNVAIYCPQRSGDAVGDMSWVTPNKCISSYV